MKHTGIVETQPKVSQLAARVRRLHADNDELLAKLNKSEKEHGKAMGEAEKLERDLGEKQALQHDLTMRVVHAKLHLEDLLQTKQQLQRRMTDSKSLMRDYEQRLSIERAVLQKLGAADNQRWRELRDLAHDRERATADAGQLRSKATHRKQQLAATSRAADERRAALRSMQERRQRMELVVRDALHAAEK